MVIRAGLAKVAGWRIEQRVNPFRENFSFVPSLTTLLVQTQNYIVQERQKLVELRKQSSAYCTSYNAK